MAPRKLVIGMMVAAACTSAAAVGVSVEGASAQVDVPNVEVPDVQVPSVPVAPPALPVAPPPAPSPPSLAPPAELPQPDVQIPSAPSLPQTPAPGDVGSTGEAGDLSATSPSSAAGAPGATTGPGGGEGATGSPGSPSVSGPGERSLRRKVRELSGCFDALPRFQRRVLDLRTGLGDAPARSRRTVAGRLDVSMRRVLGAEREGLRELRSSDRTSGCAGVGSTFGMSWSSMKASVSGPPTLLPLAGLTGPDIAAAVASRAAVLGDRESGGVPELPFGGSRSGGDAARGGGAAGVTGAALDDGGTPVVLWLLAGLVALVFLGAAAPVLRSRRSISRDPLAGVELPPAPAAPRSAVGASPPPAPWIEEAPSGTEEASSQPAPTPAVPPRPRAAASQPVAPPITGGDRAKRAIGVAVSNAVSLAVGIAVRARSRSGGQRRRR